MTYIPDFGGDGEDDGPPPMRARFVGWCHVCRDDIGEGDWIAYDDGEGRWGHQDCVG